MRKTGSCTYLSTKLNFADLIGADPLFIKIELKASSMYMINVQ